VRQLSVVAEPVAAYGQLELLGAGYPERSAHYPKLRYMGSKSRLLPWIFTVLSELEFDTALDAFSGSGCVSYLFKAMDKQVWSNDFLNMGATIARAVVENSQDVLSAQDMKRLLRDAPDRRTFIEDTFSGIFFKPEDLVFLDSVWSNIRRMRNVNKRAVALSALIRSCAKRQPRGVFTIAGDPEKYKDGRRDLRLGIQEHFLEQVAVYNETVFDNARDNHARVGNVFEWDGPHVDLVYMDPPYVPRADDNCYMKRYHFLEGLSCYWHGKNIMENTRVKKIEKPFTPFSYRRTAVDAFDSMFSKFAASTLVLSYSSNGYPDLAQIVDIMAAYKKRIRVFSRKHRYHFGTHSAVKRSIVDEYLIIGE
jgi:adenine-specific DNA-methyltransferase